MKRLTLPIVFVLALVAWNQPATAASLHAKKFSYFHRSTGMMLTIGKSEYDTTGSGITHPAAGMMFQMCYVIVRNKGTRVGTFNPLDLTIVANNGQTYDTTAFLPNEYHQINLVKLSPHTFRTGWIGWQVPRKAKTLSIYWDDQSTIDPPALLVHLHPN